MDKTMINQIVFTVLFTMYCCGLYTSEIILKIPFLFVAFVIYIFFALLIIGDVITKSKSITNVYICKHWPLFNVPVFAILIYEQHYVTIAALLVVISFLISNKSNGDNINNA